MTLVPTLRASVEPLPDCPVPAPPGTPRHWAKEFMLYYIRALQRLLDGAVYWDPGKPTPFDQMHANMERHPLYGALLHVLVASSHRLTTASPEDLCRADAIVIRHFLDILPKQTFYASSLAQVIVHARRIHKFGVVSTCEAAKMLGVSRQRIHERVRTGSLHPIRLFNPKIQTQKPRFLFLSEEVREISPASPSRPRSSSTPNPTSAAVNAPDTTSLDTSDSKSTTKSSLPSGVSNSEPALTG